VTFISKTQHADVVLIGGGIMSATLGAYAGFTWHLPLVVHLLVVIVMGVIGGAIWGGIVGILKARTGAHEVIEGAERLLQRRHRIEPMQLIQVDVVGTETPETTFDGVDEVMARRAEIVRSGAGAERPFCGNEGLMTAALQRLSQDLFRLSA